MLSETQNNMNRSPFPDLSVVGSILGLQLEGQPSPITVPVPALVGSVTLGQAMLLGP